MLTSIDDAFTLRKGNILVHDAHAKRAALLQAGANTDRPHLIEVAERLGKGKAMAISRKQLTPKSMMALGIAIGEVNAAHLQPS